ncbi:MAG: hypothetical protein IKL09_01440, partial [Clostridia bacterium]|nr:hypothetical protein [Clostridia bacterium]
EGECTVTFALTAKGYKTAQCAYKVMVRKPIMFSISADGKSIEQKFSIYYGETSTLNILSAVDGADFNVKSSDEKIVSVSYNNSSWLISPVSAGNALLEVSASAEGYANTSVSIPVEILKNEAYLSLETDRVTSYAGNTSLLLFKCQPHATITAFSDDPNLSLSVKENSISIFSNVSGNYNVTVKCESENYLTSEKHFTAVFTPPPVPLTVPKSCELYSGEKSSFAITGYPSGTEISISHGAKLDVSLQNGIVTFYAKAAGSDFINIAAEKEGYQFTQVKIPVTIKPVAIEIKKQFESHIKEVINLVNAERTRRGLDTLYILSELEQSTAIRAKEVSEEWSHTRPDNREWQTVLYDTGVNFILAGENLLEINALDAQEAVNAWMASPGHRENILRKNFVYTYVGIYKSGSTYWYCQHFIER